jgi:uncharacterized protein (TIGR01777 family)
MKIAVTGSHGLVGSALVVHLRAAHHEVIPIVREKAGSGEIAWDPRTGTIDSRSLNGLDAVVHLAGAGVGDHRWSQRYKEVIRASRVDGTSALADALAELSVPPKVLVSASAVGYYGTRGDEELTESSGPGSGFLADVCAQWEAATAPASAAGVRVVHVRTGVVLSGAGGALKKELLPFTLGLGARLGSGRQQFSWITRPDAVAAICFLIEHEATLGPVNVTSPRPVSNAEFTRALARTLHRPAVLAVPEWALRTALGQEMTAEFLLASQRAIPQVLLGAGFRFGDEDLTGALKTALDDRARIPRG